MNTSIKNETILKIEEISNYPINQYQRGAGYHIVTDKEEYFFLIEQEYHCCEDFGSEMLSEDNPKDYIGAQLFRITETNTAYKTTEILADILQDIECSSVFFNIETSEGTFQIVLYNRHNGYYGHNAVAFSKSGKLRFEHHL